MTEPVKEKTPAQIAAYKAKHFATVKRTQAKRDEIMAHIKRAITRFDTAAQDYAFMGAQPPEYHHFIENEYKNSRVLLESRIRDLIK
jgi:hypothetical protein